MLISIQDILSIHRHMTFFIVVLFLMTLTYSCKEERTKEMPSTDLLQKDSTYYQEPFRSQFHFSPEKGWMNDPNGLVYHKGIYHLFYQYYPDSTVWGPMHWGHAVSKDLLHWQHKPIALFPDEHGYIFSGSAVVDTANSSGLGSEENPPLVAIFTYHLMEGEKAGRNDFQTQGIAYSLDDGESWTKYTGNPVIANPGIRDFRDPKVFWDEDGQQWVLVLVAGDHAQFFKSDNLKEWQLMSDFGKEKGAHGGVWECPDLFKMRVEGAEEEKWVLLVSINPGAPNGGSGTQYFVGDFDGKNFTTDQKMVKWIDYGADNYAGVTYNNTPNGKRIFMGWMSNWNYAQVTPTKTWRSAMTLPRELHLIKRNNTYQLTSEVYPSLKGLSQPIVHRDKIDLTTPFEIDSIHCNQVELMFKTTLSKQLQLEFSNQKNEKLMLVLDPETQLFSVDRRASGMIDFEKRFAESIHTMPFEKSEEEVDVRILVDWSSIEIIIQDGAYVMTEQFFPNEYMSHLTITTKDNTQITNFSLNSINSIWNDE